MKDVVRNRLTRSRSALLQDQPWFGVQAMYLELVQRDDIPTMAVDGKHLFYSPQFVGRTHPVELMAVFAHEVMHCSLRHPWRRSMRDPELWNIAADYAINQILVDAGFRLPQGALLDSRFRGWTAEAVYAWLRNQQQPQNQQGPGGSGNGQQQKDQAGAHSSPSPGQSTAEGLETSPARSNAQQTASQTGGKPQNPMGEVWDAPKQSDGEPISGDDWKIAAEQAMRVAMRAGKLPAHIEQVMTEVREGHVDWTALLQEFVARLSPVNYSWTRPSRRSHSGVILPSTTRDQLGDIVVALDTSGSISDTMYRQFLAEICTILQEARPRAIHLMQCDAAVKSLDEYEPGDDVSLKRAGYGGTKFQPTFDRITAEGLEPAAMVYFSDLDSSDTPTEPDYPVLWVAPEWVQREAPFGRLVKMEVR